MIPTALQTPFRRQWDDDSKLPGAWAYGQDAYLYPSGTAPGNCGVTCVAMISQFYTDRWHGIYDTRRLVVRNDREMFTRTQDQALMLAKRGVPNTISRPSLTAIKNMVRTGRWPVSIGMNFAKVPLAVAGHPFRGNHSVVARGLNSRGELLMADPNFNRTFRIDPTGGRRPYPDWVVQAAYYNAGHWCIVPTKPKLVSLPDTTTEEDLPVLLRTFKPPRQVVIKAGVSIKAAPRHSARTITKTTIETDPQVLIGLTKGDSYDYQGGRLDVWCVYRIRGETDYEGQYGYFAYPGGKFKAYVNP